MGIAGVVAFAGGAGVEPASIFLTAIALTTALFWQPNPELSARLERVWLCLATLLVIRALFHVFIIRDDVVIPVVDLLFLLLAAESLRSLDAPNDLRLYALSFALILASTAYRPGIVFLAAFIAYVGLATVTLLVGHVRRTAERHSIRKVPIGPNSITTTTLLTGTIFISTSLVFITFPRVSQGWTGRGEDSETSIAGFTDQISIGEHGSTILGNPEIILRVEFPNGPPANLANLRWRGRSYDRFDGVRWTRSAALPPFSTPPSWYNERWSNDVLEQKIFAVPLDVRVLFALHPAFGITTESRIQPLFDNAGDLVYWGSGAPVYTAYSPAAPPSADELRVPTRGYTPSNRHYLQLPELEERIRLLADSITANADNRYDRAVAIRDWLHTFHYTRLLPSSADETSLEYFLFERKAGHCEYFSTAMVVLLRSIGIHARNVNGFLGGEWNRVGNYLVVTQNEAHSWVEVWFPEYGWVAFDPTPSGIGQGEVSTSWYWPGRVFLDGLQHRWNHWVLNYSVDEQAGIFASLRGLSQPEGRQDNAEVDQDNNNYWAIVLLVLLLASGYYWARGVQPQHTPATSIYLQLRSASSRAGLEVGPSTTPHTLVEKIRRKKSAAVHPAEQVVDLYLRARYGKEDLDQSELHEMKEALGIASKRLKA